MFGNDAFKIHLADMLKQRSTVLLYMICITYSRCKDLWQTPEFLFAVCQPFRPQIPAIRYFWAKPS